MAGSVIGSLRVSLGLDSAQFNRGAKQAQTTAQRIGKSLQKIGAAASVVGAGVALAIRGQLNAADQLGKSAQSLGVPVEALSQLQHAAKMSGVSLSSLETGLRRLSQNMAEDSSAFEELGISIRDVNGEMRPTVDVMAEVADALSGMPDGAEKTALAMELMGRSGAEMIPMLNGGADALREMMDEADRLGLTISQDTAEAAAAFNDNLSRLTGQIGGVVRIITAELAPVLEKISDVVVKVAERFQGMSPEMRRFASIAAVIAVAIGPVLIALGSLVLIVGAISAPVLLAVAGIAALTAGLVAFWPQIIEVKDALVDMVNNGIEKVTEAIEFAEKAFLIFTGSLIHLGVEGVQFVKDKLRELVAFLAELPARFREAGANMMRGLVDGIKSNAASVRDSVMDTVGGAYDGALRFLRIRSPSRLFAEVGQNISAGLALGIRENAQAPIDAIGEVAASAQAATSASFNLGESLAGVFADAAFEVKRLDEGVKDLLSSMGRLFLNQAFTQFLGGIFPTLNFGGARADGGPVSSGRTYLVGERGPELFTPGASGGITPNHAMGGGGNVIVNNYGSPDDVRVQKAPNGDTIIETMVRAARDDFARGGWDKASQRFGLSPAKVRR